MKKSGFSLDFSDFEKKSTRMVERAYPDAISMGLRKAGQEWKFDADNIAPRTPHLEGHLRGSGKVSKAKVKGRETTVEVSYGTPYARRWHEAEPGTVSWSEPEVGPKFLESKAARFAKKYIGIVVSWIRSAK